MTPFTKTVITTYLPIWSKREFTVFNGEYVNLRNNFEYQGFNCFKCDKKFELGDIIGLACLEGVGNKVFCQECVVSLE